MSLIRKRIRTSNSFIRNELLQEKTINLIKSSWKDFSVNCQTLKELNIEIINYPFPVCLIHNFIEDNDLLESTIDEVEKIEFYEKSNDLYQFKQSDDLSNLRNFQNIKQLYESIKTEGRNLVSKIFGENNLKHEIAATFSSYQKHDRLLCHDDKHGDRCIAFILYLAKNWTESDGGSLALFTADENGHPNKIFKHIYPKFNTLVLFKVTHTSYHQVSEVLTNKNRLSLNGWYLSMSNNLDSNEFKVLVPEKSTINNEIYDFNNYFLNDYFEEGNVINIKKQFCNSSEIQLDKFLLPNFWKDVKKSFDSDEIKWLVKGPANMRNYEVACPSSLPKPLEILKNIFESKEWLKFLKRITSLDFDVSENSDESIWNCGILPSCNCEVQKWSLSNYTLIHDKNPEMHCEALDMVLRIPNQEQSHDCRSENMEVPESGHIIYVDGESNDEECLLHVGYKFNSLALVYRDSKTLKFTKYLDSDSRPFYQVFCTYNPWRPPPDRPDLKHCEENDSDENTSSSNEFAEDQLVEPDD